MNKIIRSHEKAKECFGQEQVKPFEARLKFLLGELAKSHKVLSGLDYWQGNGGFGLGSFEITDPKCELNGYWRQDGSDAKIFASMFFAEYRYGFRLPGWTKNDSKLTDEIIELSEFTVDEPYFPSISFKIKV